MKSSGYCHPPVTNSGVIPLNCSVTCSVTKLQCWTRFPSSLIGLHLHLVPSQHTCLNYFQTTVCSLLQFISIHIGGNTASLFYTSSHSSEIVLSVLWTLFLVLKPENKGKYSVCLHIWYGCWTLISSGALWTYTFFLTWNTLFHLLYRYIDRQTDLRDKWTEDKKRLLWISQCM